MKITNIVFILFVTCLIQGCASIDSSKNIGKTADTNKDIKNESNIPISKRKFIYGAEESFKTLLLYPDKAVASQPSQNTQTVTWYLKAAKQGDAEAQHILGDIYAKGESDKGEAVFQSYAMASGWYRKAAKQGHADSQYILGAMYLSGLAVKYSDTISFLWMKAAAEQGHVGAQLALACRYLPRASFGYTRTSEVIKWFKKASEQEGVDSPFIQTMTQVRKNKAVKWFNKASEQGNDFARIMLLKLQEK